MDIIEIAINMEYSVARLNEFNLIDLEDLYLAVYNKKKETGLFSNKYNTAYTGVKNVGFIAYDSSGYPIGYYGVIPCFLEHEGKRILAAQSADTMTHPKYRQKGLFKNLSEMTFQLCKKLGIKLIFGFPNQNFKKAISGSEEWKLGEAMQIFTIPLDCIALKSLVSRFPFLRKIYLKYQNYILRKYRLDLLGLKNSVLSENLCGVLRSYDYLQTKRSDRSFVLGIDNAKIWINVANSFNIGDMEGISETNFKKIISKLSLLSKRLGLKQIVFQTSPETYLYKLFTNEFQARDSFPIILNDFESGIPFKKIKFVLADIDIF